MNPRLISLSLFTGLWFALAFAAGAKPQSATPVHSEQCLSCHGQQGMASESGRSIYVDPAKHQTSVHGTLGCTTCHTSIKD
jgi:hypothetical protein